MFTIVAIVATSPDTATLYTHDAKVIYLSTKSFPQHPNLISDLTAQLASEGQALFDMAQLYASPKLEDTLRVTHTVTDLDDNTVQINPPTVDLKDNPHNLDVSPLLPQMLHASESNSDSVSLLLKRMNGIKRKHSAESLVDFIASSELPITKSGLVVAYKRVNRIVGKDGYFRDIHSGKVIQRIGSELFMSLENVDDDRNASCSSGLHVANLKYLSGFSGDATMMVVVAPEDFIAVPNGEIYKARVCKYRIVGILPQGSHEATRFTTNALKDEDFLKLLGQVTDEQFPPILERIHVGKFGESTIELVEEPEAQPEPTEAPQGKTLQAITEAQNWTAAVAQNKTSPLKAEMRKLYERWEETKSEGALFSMRRFKQEKKQSYKALGLTDAEIAQIPVSK